MIESEPLALRRAYDRQSKIIDKRRRGINIRCRKHWLPRLERERDRERIICIRPFSGALKQGCTEGRVLCAGGAKYVLACKLRTAVVVNRMRRVGFAKRSTKPIEDHIA